MIIKLKTLITLTLLCSFAGFGVLGGDDNSGLAPEIAAGDINISLRDTPVLEEAFIDATPAYRENSVPVGRLGIDGGKKDTILELAKDIAEIKYGRYDSLLIAHKGKLLFESYYERGRINLPHAQASATKAYLSLAVGRAIQLGYLSMSDLGKPVVHFLADLESDKFTGGAETITLNQAMSMSSGIDLDREKWDDFEEKNLEILKGQGQIQAYLEHSAPITSKSPVFDYKFTDPSMTMQVLEAVVPGSAEDFIKEELLDKLGITVYGWRKDESGLPSGNSGARMTSRDMVKWGTLVMNKGKWKGEQLIPEAFITRATNKVITVDDIFFVAENVVNPSYGYYWWQADLKVGNKTYFSTSAQGGGGQYIILIEELDLIVVATGHRRAADPEREVRTLQLTAERILPAFIQ